MKYGQICEGLEHRLMHLDVGLDFCAQLLEVLNYGAIDSASEVGVLVSNAARLVSNPIKYILCRS